MAVNKPGTIGLPYPGNAFRVVDVEDPTREMPRGEPGELMYSGPLVMMGYHNNPAATAETIRADGWLHTGDIATMDDDGYATIVDRKKDMILTAGFNVYPAELERVLCMHPAVALSAVGGIPDEAKGELAKAYVMLRPGAEATQRGLDRPLPRAPGCLQGPARRPVRRIGADDALGQDHAQDAARTSTTAGDSPSSPQAAAVCSRAMRSSIGGWVENSLPTPEVIPKAWMLLGNSPGTMPPRRARALIIGCLRPSRPADPASARNSRWR